jgi:hypothetical protein
LHALTFSHVFEFSPLQQRLFEEIEWEMLVEKPNGGSVYFQATNLSDTMLALVLERKISLQNKARHHTEFTTKRPPLLFGIRFIRSSKTMPASI